ncbi:MAG: helix-turn-helix transcriptional regulator [Bacilli bacterium]|nr:helix-turn-helix transcriptional regulator [Bacilli bacterium]
MEMHTVETIGKCPYTASFRMPPTDVHQSTFFVLTIVEKGEATLFFHSSDGVETAVDVKEDDCFFLLPFSPVQFKNVSPSFFARDIFVSEKKMKECCDFLEPGLYDKLIDSTSPIVFQLSPSAVIFLAESSSQLMGERINDEKDSFHKSLISTILSLYTSSKSTNVVYPVWLSGFLRKLEEEDASSMSVEDMVKSTNYSHGYVNREFKKYLGCSIIQFTIRKKLEKATVLIATTSLSIESISDSLNFSNVSNFINIFKKRYGITPAKYRKLHGSSVQMDTYQEWGKITYSNK